jgi:hypothetical protein
MNASVEPPEADHPEIIFMLLFININIQIIYNKKQKDLSFG